MKDSTHKRTAHLKGKKWLRAFFLLLLPYLSFSQNTFLDSLLQLSKTAPADTNKVILLTDIAWEYKFDDFKKANEYLDEALVLAEQLEYLKGQGLVHNFRGVVNDIHGNSQEAIAHFQKALKIRRRLATGKEWPTSTITLAT